MFTLTTPHVPQNHAYCLRNGCVALKGGQISSAMDDLPPGVPRHGSSTVVLMKTHVRLEGTQGEDSKTKQPQ